MSIVEAPWKHPYTLLNKVKIAHGFTEIMQMQLLENTVKQTAIRSRKLHIQFRPIRRQIIEKGYEC